MALGTMFNAARTIVQVTSFPPIIVGPFSTVVGPNTTTITHSAGGIGRFTETTGDIAVSIDLFFNHSIDILFYEEDSTLPFMLGTGSSGTLVGAPLNRGTCGLTLVGTGVFSGRFLGSSLATLTIAGALADLP